MKNSRVKKIFAVLSLAFAATLVLAGRVNAQLGAEVGAQAGLGGGDIRVIVGRIIQVVLGLLGAVALILIIYAGFLWMTAGGDEEKVATAKRTITQAVIGLVIILSAFAIASFVVNSLVAATGGNTGNGGNGGNGGGGGGLSTSDFTVSAINPPGDKAADFKFPKNVQIAIIFKNGSPDPTTTTAGAISVKTGGASVAGTVRIAGNTAIWSSTTKCEENADYFCLPADSVFNVSISASVTSGSGRPLVCGLCSASFQTGNYIDTQPPTVAISSPVNNQSVPVDSSVKIFADAHDDSAVASVDYSADSKDLGSVGIAPWENDWDTTGIVAGTQITLGAVATDIVGNTGNAAPVNVIARPAHCFDGAQDFDETGKDCGASCGACPGAPCKTDADCFSGVCVNNVCVEKPRIDSVDPTAGGPGTLVTIHGAGFGSPPGSVIFLGAKTGDQKTAAPCAPSAWTNYEVVVAVPDGAVSGPLELDTSSGTSDRTNDAFGNATIPDFTVTNVTLPGICTLDPAAGAPGTPVDINGTGYGDNQGTNEADFAGRSANVSTWSGAKVSAAAPNLLAGIWPVKIKVGSAFSNSVSFMVPPANGTPHILSIDPPIGPVGEYITITGANFGDTAGKVNFIQGQDTYLGGVDFPAACSTNYWHDTSITVKAPAGGAIGAYTVRVIANSGVPSDNTASFSIGGGTPKPGLCSIDPAAGPPGTKFTLYGERLGSDTGTVTFTNNKNVNSFSAWSDGQVMGAVASAAATGPVTATPPGGQTSNNVLFTVGDCKTANICAAGATCCDDGTCRQPKADGSSACVPAHHDGAYAYRFSTGTIPLVPHVIEDVACDKYTQSPSPYLKSVDACVNAVVSVRFDVGMNNNTLVPANFTIVSCGDDDTFDQKKCSTTPVTPLKVVAFGASRPVESGMDFISKDNFTKNTWYMGTIAKNVASVAGVNMDQDYVWIFRTRDSDEPCALSGINVCPADNVLTDIWKPTDGAKQENITYSAYLASPHAANCNAVKCEAYGWDWNTDTPNSVAVTSDVEAGVTTCSAVARAISETPAAKAAKVNAVASVLGSPAKTLGTGTGNLTVKFTDPKVASYWPACANACLEAQVGAKFNTTINAATITTDNVKIFSCADETCRTTTDLGAAVDLNPDGETLTFPKLPLSPNKYYLVRITNDVMSTAGVRLTGTNSVWNGKPVFSWYLDPKNPTASFRIGTDHCTVAAVTVVPPNVTTNVVGEYDSFTAVPATAPDSCSPTGEKIDPFQIKNWTWNIDPTPPPPPPPAPTTSAGTELYEKGTANVRPLDSLFVTSSCLRTGTVSSKPVCGNGVVEDGLGRGKPFGVLKGGGAGGEECDLGKLNDAPGTPTDGSTGAGCSANCLLTGARVKVCTNGGTGCCGDSVVQGICQDDPSNYVQSANPVACTSNADCANGVCRFDVPGAEQCDAGANNGKPNSGCSTLCLALGSNSITPSSTCGNTDLAFNEQCEDANTASGDGCSAECLDEGSTAGLSVCGNGKLESGEDCDCGNDSSNLPKGCAAPNGRPGSTCSAICLNTGTPICASLDGKNCCGNQTVDPGEDPGCDLGLKNGRPSVAEGCDLSCRKLGSSFAYSSPSVCADTVVGAGETVDPGPSDQNIDPTQFSHTIGVGQPDTTTKAFTSTITAATGGISGTGTVILQCGYTADNQCPVGTYVGYNTCCYGPPAVVVPVAPPDGKDSVCRNPLISVPFDRLLDEKTLAGNLTVTKTFNCQVGMTPAKTKGWTGFLHQVSAFLGRIWNLLVGRPAEAQGEPCKVSGTITPITETKAGQSYTVLQFIPDIALDPAATYKISVLGIDDAGAHLRSLDGIAMQSDFNSYFTTGPDICTLDKVLINTDPAATANMNNYLFSDPNRLTDTFNAIPVHDDGTSLQPIAPLPEYDWTWQWNSTTVSPVQKPPITLVTANGTAAAQPVKVVDPDVSGDAAVTAAATITADRVSKVSTEKTSVAGETDVTVMMCSAPWPARASDGGWAPWPMANAGGTNDNLPDNKYNFSFYYCRDSDNGQLPALANPVMTDYDQNAQPTPQFLRQYLLTYTDLAHKSEGIGLRVAGNPMWLTPTAFYASRGFTGAPQPLKVAGYNAVLSGNTVYVDAPNYGAGLMYPNMYVLSYSAGAGPDTQNIFTQIKNNLRFNTNLTSLDLATCDGNRAQSCVTDADCQKTDKADFCASPRDRLSRDVLRYEDLSTVAKAAVNLKNLNGAFPSLGSGSYLGGSSYSIWPSWTGEFTAELGAAPPTDPLNKIGACNGGGFDPSTCWNDAAKQFVCPADAYVFGYNLDPVYGFNFAMNAESKEYDFAACPANSDLCAADPLCLMVHGQCVPRINNSAACNGATITGGSSVCGDGIVESGEGCEKGMTEYATCNGPSTYTLMTCDASCEWQPGACNQISCGDGVREGLCGDNSPCAKNSDCAKTGGVCNYKEVCDEGKLNGTYGHCNASCSGYSASCGNDKLDTGEKCDDGAQNGQYSTSGSGCALDCQGLAPYCGDGKVNGPETCDGGSETTTTGCPKDPATGVQEIKTRTCNAPGAANQCQWDNPDWSTVACAVPAGVGCGDGVKQANEQCDKGSKNSDNGPCLTNCKLASCGDGFIRAGVEQCDDGSNNVSPTDTNKLAQVSANCKSATCSYCTTACTVGTISGGYCGDNIVQKGEVCDVGAGNNGVYHPKKDDSCGLDCKTHGSYCGDGVISNGEQCDSNLLGTYTDCTSYGGFNRGALSCDPNTCAIDTSACQQCAFTLTGLIKDSQSGKGVPNQPIQAFCGSTLVGTGASDASGNYAVVVPNTPALDSCGRSLTVKSIAANGYCFDDASQTITVPVGAYATCSSTIPVGTIMVVTQEPASGKYTFVLTWGATPANLDIHTKEINANPAFPGACSFDPSRHIIAPCTYASQTPNSERRCVVNGALDQNQICTNNSDCTSGGPCACISNDNGNVFLDIDAKNGYGPETITVTAHDNMTGFIYVNSNDASGTQNGPSFAGSNAQVRVWSSDCQEKTYSVTGAEGYGINSSPWWEVFNYVDVNGTMQFTSRSTTSANGKIGVAPQMTTTKLNTNGTCSYTN